MDRNINKVFEKTRGSRGSEIRGEVQFVQWGKVREALEERGIFERIADNLNPDVLSKRIVEAFSNEEEEDIEQEDIKEEVKTIKATKPAKAKVAINNEKELGRKAAKAMEKLMLKQEAKKEQGFFAKIWDGLSFTRTAYAADGIADVEIENCVLDTSCFAVLKEMKDKVLDLSEFESDAWIGRRMAATGKWLMQQEDESKASKAADEWIKQQKSLFETALPKVIENQDQYNDKMNAIELKRENIFGNDGFKLKLGNDIDIKTIKMTPKEGYGKSFFPNKELNGIELNKERIFGKEKFKLQLINDINAKDLKMSAKEYEANSVKIVFQIDENNKIKVIDKSDIEKVGSYRQKVVQILSPVFNGIEASLEQVMKELPTSTKYFVTKQWLAIDLVMKWSAEYNDGKEEGKTPKNAAIEATSDTIVNAVISAAGGAAGGSAAVLLLSKFAPSHPVVFGLTVVGSTVYCGGIAETVLNTSKASKAAVQSIKDEMSIKMKAALNAKGDDS